MSEPSPPATLDQLAADLATAVRDASTARTDAALVAQFDTMRGQLEAATGDIAACMNAVADPDILQLPEDMRTVLEDRKVWLTAQIEKMRAAVKQDPARIRQGSLWRDTRTAAETLRKELVAATTASYHSLLGQFGGDDRRLFETLPPGTPGARDYKAAIDRFEALVAEPPRSAEDVKRATVVGERVRQLREQVESAAVPPEFQRQWRLVREEGLLLTEITDEFREWLTESGLAPYTVLRYQAG